MSATGSRPKIIAGNWKMNHTSQETEVFFQKLGTQLKNLNKVTKLIFPAYLSLETAIKNSRTSGIEVGAQNVHWEKSGAFTGEVSGPMCLERGITWALVGHSERRQYFGETDESAGRRLESLLTQGMKVIFCVGETESERKSGSTQAVLTRQTTSSLGGRKGAIAPFFDGRLVIAYEPVWAIGTGLTATPQQAEEAHQILRRLVWDLFGMQASGQTPLLYGGSVNPQNIDQLLACPNIDGALVGGASLKAESFMALCQAAGK